jgi:hypothetical protein
VKVTVQLQPGAMTVRVPPMPVISKPCVSLRWLAILICTTASSLTRSTGPGTRLDVGVAPLTRANPSWLTLVPSISVVATSVMASSKVALAVPVPTAQGAQTVCAIAAADDRPDARGGGAGSTKLEEVSPLHDKCSLHVADLKE